MSATSTITAETGAEEEVTLANVVQQLKAIEEIIRPMQPVHDAH
jgi:hypothetical protein